MNYRLEKYNQSKGAEMQWMGTMWGSINYDFKPVEIPEVRMWANYTAVEQCFKGIKSFAR